MDRGYRGGNFDRVVRRVCDGDTDTGERSINGTGVVAERKGSDEPPELPRDEKETGNYNIKRVIGLPGETVQIKDGYIYINNEKLDAPNDLGKAALAGLAEYPISLDKNEYFLLGDNRSGSEDSRFSNVGNVKFRQIKGKVWLRIQPVSRFGLISSR